VAAPAVVTKPGSLGAICSLYCGALAIGFTQVSYSASSTVLRQVHGFSDTQYGAIYLPLLVAAIVGALGGGTLAQRVGIKPVYSMSLVLILLSQAMLAASAMADSMTAFNLILLSTSSFGFGFGLCVGSLNALAVALFPNRPHSSITVLHMIAGVGFATGPILFGAFANAGHWAMAPTAVALFTGLVLLVTLRSNVRTAAPATDDPAVNAAVSSSYFWLMVCAAFLYAMAEGTFSNWAVIYLKEVLGQSLETAVLALTTFWTSITVGRLVLSFAMVAIRPVVIALTLPLLMAVAFIGLPHVDSRASALSFYAIAGFGCSALFPLIIGLTSSRFKQSVAWCASILTAAMMAGGGVGTFAVGLIRSHFSLPQIFWMAAGVPAALFLLMALAEGRTVKAAHSKPTTVIA